MHNYNEIITAIEQNPDIAIEVVNITDDVCTPCPLRRDSLCSTQDKINDLDRRHSEMLGIHAGDVLSWNKALAKIKQRVTLTEFHKACHTCEWKPLGICENKIKQSLSS